MSSRASRSVRVAAKALVRSGTALVMQRLPRLISTAFEDTCKEKRPSMSVTVPLVVPFSTTLAPTTGPSASFTTRELNHFPNRKIVQTVSLSDFLFKDYRCFYK